MCATVGRRLLAHGRGVRHGGRVRVGRRRRRVLAPGPGTGLPTWTEQGDLQFVIHAAQGEFPRVVLAPGDRDDAFHLTWQAFNLADQLQTPVVLLGDSYLSDNRQSVAAVRHRSGRRSTAAKLDHRGRGRRRLPALQGHRRRRLAARAARREGRRAAREQLRARRVRLGPGGRARRGARRAEREAHAQDGPRARRSCRRPSPSARDEADVSIVSFGTTKGPIRDAMTRLRGARASRVELPAGRDRAGPSPPPRWPTFLARRSARSWSRTTSRGSSSSSSAQECLLAPTSTCTATTAGCSRTRRSPRRSARWRAPRPETAEVVTLDA